MAEAVTIQVQPRDPAKNKGTGTRVSRKLRAQGRVPAIVYGHKKTPVPISLSSEDVAMMLKKSVHLAQLSWDGTTELAVVRATQWDHLGKAIIHLDFLRVDAGEQVEAEVAIELHGTPVGINQGGRLEQLTRSIKINARPTSIPKFLTVEVGELGVGDSIHVKELRSMLPEGVTTEMDDSLLIVHVVEKKTGAAEATDEAEMPAPAEDGDEEDDEAESK